MVAESPSDAFQTIPVIDISTLLSSKDLTARALTARQLHEACRDVGFFYIKNHGIAEDVLQGVLDAAQQWFSLPEETKKQMSLSSESKFRGYQALGSNVTRYDNGFARDWHEGIDLYKETEGRDNEDSPVHGKNPWPDQLEGFKSMLQEYFRSCLVVGEALMRGIASGLGLEEDYFETKVGGGTNQDTSYWVARVLHYPPLIQGDSHLPEEMQKACNGHFTERSVQLSCGEHTDYGLLTLVNQQPGMAALQVKNQDGKWISAPPIHGTLVCNIGDMLQVYTNGIYTPTAHRVVNADPTKSRISLPFFYECAFESIVRPVQALIPKGQEGRHTEIQYGKHLLGKVLSNFEL